MSSGPDLLDVLFDLEQTPTPNVDTKRGYRPTYERCPDCDHMSYAMPWHGRNRTYKVLGCGWLTTSSCECGRYRWQALYDGRIGGWHPLALPEVVTA